MCFKLLLLFEEEDAVADEESVGRVRRFRTGSWYGEKEEEVVVMEGPEKMPSTQLSPAFL